MYKITICCFSVASYDMVFLRCLVLVIITIIANE